MKTALFVLISAAALACNNETTAEVKTETAVETKAINDKTTDAAPAQQAGAKQSTDLTPVIGEIDMGDYIFRVHELIAHHPNEMQSEFMKLNDKEHDYFLVDASVESKSDDIVYTGKDILKVYFVLSDGSTFKNPTRSAVIVGSYNMDNKGQFVQKSYDQIWGHQFPAKGIARTILYGVETPEGVTVKTIGFHKTDAAKNKFTDLK